MRKLFANDRFFLLMTAFAVFGELAVVLICIFGLGYSLQSRFTLLLRVICVAVLYISYKRHSKNVMKGMMGALLMGQLISAFIYLDEFTIPTDYVCYPVFVLLSAILFVVHFIINAEHKARPAMVFINQITAVLLFINNTVYCIAWIIARPIPLEIIGDIIDIFGFLGMTSVVVCVESRLDLYRLNREAAGWTEEIGYPKGYVHGYENKLKK